VDGAVLGPEAFVLRFFLDGPGDRLLLVNLGIECRYSHMPEPLIAPPEGLRWRKLWSTEEPEYGGCGYAGPEAADGWIIPGHAAAVLKPAPPTAEELRREDRLEMETIEKRKREKEEHG
jgi:maltooligosyltrehalose trehalohydrolase